MVENSIYHGVGDSNCPKKLAWPRHGQHTPEKDKEGIDYGEECGGHNMIEYHHHVTALLPILADEIDDRNKEQKEP